MRYVTLKWILLLPTLFITAIIAAQLYWLNKVYSYEEKEFNNTVIKGILIHQLDLWIVAAILLLVSLIAFSISLFYLYKQKKLNELQKDFVNNFTHEFKTPLAVMKLAADVLANPFITKQPERLKKYGSIVQQQTEHLQQQVDKLLTIASTEEHNLPLEITHFVPNDMITEVIQELEPLINQKNAKIRFEKEDKNILIHADSSKLSMLVINLLENAIKYSAEPDITVATATYNGTYIISVKDNGIGIEEKHLPLLFKKFFRVPTGDVHNVKGFGLGLNFVKKIVDAHHGKIKVDSLPNIGTKFTITLPINKPLNHAQSKGITG